jgi:hypothetical protein
MFTCYMTSLNVISQMFAVLLISTEWDNYNEVTNERRRKVKLAPFHAMKTCRAVRAKLHIFS